MEKRNICNLHGHKLGYQIYSFQAQFRVHILSFFEFSLSQLQVKKIEVFA